MAKILILSFYFEPDLCAGSFRCTALVDQLSQHDVEIGIITTAPNRYSSFNKKAATFEQRGNVRVHRIDIPSHKSGMADQIMAFSEYYRGAQKLVAKNDYDLVFATSSRLFTAFLGARIAKHKKLPLYLDVRDIFVDTMTDILPTNVTWLTNPVLSLIEKYTFKAANHINLVSEGFLKYFKDRYGKSSFSFFTNGIDKEFIDASPVVRSNHKVQPLINVLYAGNIGEGQGLHNIVPGLANALKSRAQFRIIGDGGQCKILKKSISDLGLNNVQLLPPVDRGELIQEYLKADILFLHLNDYPAFEKVLPSKLFEYAAMGKPIWAGLNGYSARFVKSEISNSEVFLPGNIADAIEKFERLAFDGEPRVEFIHKFNREQIMKRMAVDILRVAKANA
jgi:glycosyltransferase involved in cell wall biosynthesis